MRTCDHCGKQTAGAVICSHCGRGVVSVGADSLDSLVQQASVPDLATLFSRAKKAGVIGSVSHYGGDTGGA